MSLGQLASGLPYHGWRRGAHSIGVPLACRALGMSTSMTLAVTVVLATLAETL